MQIAPFRIEQYFALHEFTAPHLLSSSDAECVSIADILALEPDAADRLYSQQLRYTQSEGAPELRAAASTIYTTTTAHDIVVVSAADANWAHDLAALERAFQPNTRLIYINTPHNPTGLMMPREPCRSWAQAGRPDA